MLYIKKMQPLPEVVDKINLIKRSDIWKNISEGDTKAIRKQFESLPKDSVRYTLLKEQHGLCAYCMRRIHNDSSTTIEHWAPLSKIRSRHYNIPISSEYVMEGENQRQMTIKFFAVMQAKRKWQFRYHPGMNRI